MSKLQKDLLIVGAGVAVACGGYYMYSQNQDEGNTDNPTSLSQSTLDAAKDGFPSKLDKKDDPPININAQKKNDEPSSMDKKPEKIDGPSSK